MATPSLKVSFRSLTRSRVAFMIASSASIVALLAVVSCADSAKHAAGKVERPYTVADVAANKAVKMPAFVTAEMSDGYRYALAHPDELQYIPCYCGCGLTVDHKSNLDCYVGGVDSAGTAVFDEHASFCNICLEITRDVKKLSEQGKSLRDIRAYVDQAHGEKGPGTETPLPPL